MRFSSSSCLLFCLVVALAFWSASAVDPSWKSCASAGADVVLLNITSNEWPPEKGDSLKLNVTGNNSKVVTNGMYTIKIHIDGIPFPAETGNISDFHPLPWPVGLLQFGFHQDVPSSAPTGNYALEISAVDQDKHEVFCVSLAFKVGAPHSTLQRTADSIKAVAHRGLALEKLRRRVSAQQ